jgi:hypothetical protein
VGAGANDGGIAGACSSTGDEGMVGFGGRGAASAEDEGAVGAGRVCGGDIVRGEPTGEDVGESFLWNLCDGEAMEDV